MYLKMVYCKVDVVMKVVSCKVTTIANENDDDRNEHLNCMKVVSCKVTTIANENDDNRK